MDVRKYSDGFSNVCGVGMEFLSFQKAASSSVSEFFRFCSSVFCWGNSFVIVMSNGLSFDASRDASKCFYFSVSSHFTSTKLVFDCLSNSFFVSVFFDNSLAYRRRFFVLPCDYSNYSVSRGSVSYRDFSSDDTFVSFVDTVVDMCFEFFDIDRFNSYLFKFLEFSDNSRFGVSSFGPDVAREDFDTSHFENSIIFKFS